VRWSRPSPAARCWSRRRWSTLYLSFSSGGFFADSVAFCALVALVLSVVRCALAEEPLHGLGRAAFVPATALALLGA
jgi:hypothetical protein